ncbi:MAG: hypothetical protein HY315_08115, partial [Acidobacteria bacterium]|nr:hypothetical protein [Acidobacteriota bacterium]
MIRINLLRQNVSVSGSGFPAEKSVILLLALAGLCACLVGMGWWGWW